MGAGNHTEGQTVLPGSRCFQPNSFKMKEMERHHKLCRDSELCPGNPSLITTFHCGSWCLPPPQQGARDVDMPLLLTQRVIS